MSNLMDFAGGGVPIYGKPVSSTGGFIDKTSHQEVSSVIFPIEAILGGYHTLYTEGQCCFKSSDGWIYFFGGHRGGGYSIVESWKTNGDVYEVIADLPVISSGMVAVESGNFIYLFGRYAANDTAIHCYKYDKANDIYTEITSTLSLAVHPSQCGYAKYGSYIYIFDGTNAYKYDTITDTQSASLGAYSGVAWNKANIVNNKIYIQANENIIEFDPTTDTFGNTHTMDYVGLKVVGYTNPNGLIGIDVDNILLFYGTDVVAFNISSGIFKKTQNIVSVTGHNSSTYACTIANPSIHGNMILSGNGILINPKRGM